ncbi:MAG: DUF5615 family PIN-like protein [Bacteroidota bacterium]
MRLLFDENLSFRLPQTLAEAYPGSAHVREIGLLGADDARIWTHAADEGFLLVSKDTDFYQRSILYGSPPKVVWLRVGNAPTTRVAELLRIRRPIIERFADDREAAFLILD